jgi:hypothetical protein
MTPEEEQKLRNFRLLGGGSSMELPQQQQPIAPILGQAGSGQGFAISPSILGQVPGIENITLGQAPIVSQEGIQYQTPEVQGQSKNGFFKPGGFGYEYLGPRLGENIGNFLGSQKYGTGLSADGEVTGRPISPNTLPGQTATLGATSLEFLGDATQGAKTTMQFAGQGAEYLTGLNLVEGGPVGQTYEQAVAQQEEQVAPTIQSIAGVEQTYEQAQGLPPIQLEALERLSPQPEATFTLPSGEVRSIMPGQDVASAFGRESGRPMTFQVDGGEVTVPSAQAIQTMNLGEQAAARQAQQEFLASPAAREMSNRMLRSVMYNDPYAQASAERVARMEAKPDFNRAVSDRERRGTGEMSMASATKLTGGDRDKARAMIELQRQGRDPMTGKEVEEPFEPKEIEISGKKYIQYTPNYIQPVEEPKAPKKSEIESIREEGVKAGLPENLIRQSIASKLGLDIYDEGVKNWMAGNTDTVPSVEGASESSTFDPTSLTGQDKEAYDWAMANPNAPQSAQILARLSK